MSQMNGHTARTASASSQERRVSSRARSQHPNDPQQQASQIEKSVTHLLVATKELLETLTQWSRGAATETEVSDVYVRLGYEFNIACRSFVSVGIDTTDLGPVPDTLRAILEDTLAQEASQQSLDRYLPRIRDIIINLLHGLKRKQQKLRQKTGRESNLSGSSSTRHGSVTSTAGSAGDEASTRQSSRASYVPYRSESREGTTAPQIPPFTPSSPEGRSSPSKEPDFSNAHHRFSTQDQPEQPPSTKVVPATPQETPIPVPVPPTPESPALQNATLRPPPGEQDALAALQRGGDLERRASRRFSQYQIQKHLGTSSIGMPSLPTQHSPIPNRGRDAPDSAYLSRMRGSQLHGRSRSKNTLTLEVSPQRQPSVRNRTSKADSITSQPSPDPPREPSPAVEESAKPTLSPAAESPSKARMSATITKFADYETPDAYIPAEESPVKEIPQPIEHDKDQVPKEVQLETTDAEPAPLEPEHSDPVPTTEAHPTQDAAATRPASNGSLTLYLQYKKRVKKFVLADGYAGLSLARLQVAFIEKFAWNTHSNGVDLPEIYIQDPESGVRHELEDLNDVKDYSILVLNIDDLDEVKKHFDDGFGGLKSVMDAVKTAMGDNQLALQRVADRQAEAAVEMARIAVAPTPTPVAPQARTTSASTTSARGTPSQLQEVQTLRRELAVMRQTYSTHLTDMEASMSALRAKAAAVAAAAAKAATPSMEGDSGRAYVDRGKKKLSEDSEKIINRVDDLQDIVEDLRKDVVTRGVRPLPRQLEVVSKDIQQATAELRTLREFMKREKPTWTKVGENELKAVCDDQNLLTMQEELAADLEDDLEKAAQTFALVEQATKQQNLQSGTGQGGPSRQTSRTLANGDPVDPLKAKDGVLGEVRALQPNHETRLEAIERAEKLRQLELASRRDGEFHEEVRSFVEQGRLKKSGGVEEAERLRKGKDEMARQAIWERMGGKSVYQDPEMEAAAAARHAERVAAGDSTGLEPPNTDEAGLASPADEFVEASEAPFEQSGAAVDDR